MRARSPRPRASALNVINEETQRLDRTVAEILSVSQIEAGSFEVKRDDVHLDALLEQIKADHEAQAREKRIALEFNLPPKLPILQADRDKIALALHNLVGNALKYTLDGGRIVVAAAVEKGRLSIAVSDTGIGIAAGGDREGLREVLPVEESAGGQSHGFGPGPAHRPRGGPASRRRHHPGIGAGQGQHVHADAADCRGGGVRWRSRRNNEGRCWSCKPTGPLTTAEADTFKSEHPRADPGEPRPGRHRRLGPALRRQQGAGVAGRHRRGAARTAAKG